MISETEWYEPDQVPVYEGIYKRKDKEGNIYFSYWNPDGAAIDPIWNPCKCDTKPFWGCIAYSIELAMKGQHIYSCAQSLPWCGLTEKAK